MADKEVRLIDKDKLIKKINAEIDAWAKSRMCMTADELLETIEEFEEEAQPDNGWISVDDRLPEAIYDCLVWYSCDTPFGKSKSVDITYCSRGDWCTKHLNGDNIVVLYWLPLPEPPKEVENETD